MKFFLFLFSKIFSFEFSTRENSSARKRGNDVLHQPRYLYDWPRCFLAPQLCTQECKMTLTGRSGSIILNSTLYDGITHCLWTIEAENDQNIMLKFDKSFGFDVEYHRYEKKRELNFTFRKGSPLSSTISDGSQAHLS